MNIYEILVSNNNQTHHYQVGAACITRAITLILENKNPVTKDSYIRVVGKLIAEKTTLDEYNRQHADKPS